MRPISVSVGPLATASASNIATSQAGTAATALTLTSSPYKLDAVRRIGITSVANESTVGFAIVGTDWNGYPVSEVLLGANAGVAQSLYDYATVTSITPATNTTSTVTVGTTTVASSRPISLDPYGFGTVALQVDVTGSAVYTVQQSLNDPSIVGFSNIDWINSPDANLVNSSLSMQSNYAYAPLLVRLVLNSGTGSATLTLIQHATPSI
jgi:hypothetical protein